MRNSPKPISCSRSCRRATRSPWPSGWLRCSPPPTRSRSTSNATRSARAPCSTSPTWSAATGCPFVGAGIIGPPPKSGTSNTKFYAAGPAAGVFAKLNDYGLIVRVLDGPLTAASALKMSYAGITKGFTALGAAMMLAATRGGSAAALKAELAESQPALLGYLTRQTPAMYPKAYRWVAELDEIAAFVGKDHPEHAMLEAAARLYERIAEDLAGEKKEIGEMDAFLKS